MGAAQPPAYLPPRRAPPAFASARVPTLAAAAPADRLVARRSRGFKGGGGPDARATAAEANWRERAAGAAQRAWPALPAFFEALGFPRNGSVRGGGRWRSARLPGSAPRSGGGSGPGSPQKFPRGAGASSGQAEGGARGARGKGRSRQARPAAERKAGRSRGGKPPAAGRGPGQDQPGTGLQPLPSEKEKPKLERLACARHQCPLRETPIGGACPQRSSVVPGKGVLGCHPQMVTGLDCKYASAGGTPATGMRKSWKQKERDMFSRVSF